MYLVHIVIRHDTIMWVNPQVRVHVSVQQWYILQQEESNQNTYTFLYSKMTECSRSNDHTNK